MTTKQRFRNNKFKLEESGLLPRPLCESASWGGEKNRSGESLNRKSARNHKQLVARIKRSEVRENSGFRPVGLHPCYKSFYIVSNPP